MGMFYPKTRSGRLKKGAFKAIEATEQWRAESKAERARLYRNAVNAGLQELNRPAVKIPVFTGKKRPYTGGCPHFINGDEKEMRGARPAWVARHLGALPDGQQFNIGDARYEKLQSMGEGSVLVQNLVALEPFEMDALRIVRVLTTT